LAWLFLMTKKTPTPLLGNTPTSFEAAMAELAQLVTRMEAGELALEESVQAYARGSELVRYCAAQLDKVEQQVNILDGELLKPFQANGDDREIAS
jgi:exodeoxyribonuclease VII small subunit